MNFKKHILNFIQLLIGVTLMACGISLFLLPNQLSSGGFTGIATVLFYLFKWPVGTVILILNIPSFIIAFFKLGKNYVFKSILGTVMLSIAIDIMTQFKPLTQDKILASIYGGIIVGIGIAIVFKSQSSTGGTDVLARILHKIKPGIRTSEIMMYMDGLIVAINMVVLKKVEIGLYSAIAIFLISKMLDIFFEGINFAKMVFIISDKSNEIADEILKKLERGTTGLYGKGMYTNEEKLVLFTVTGRKEIIQIKQIAQKIDKNCFVIVNNIREVVGEGFD